MDCVTCGYTKYISTTEDKFSRSIWTNKSIRLSLKLVQLSTIAANFAVNFLLSCYFINNHLFGAQVFPFTFFNISEWIWRAHTKISNPKIGVTLLIISFIAPECHKFRTVSWSWEFLIFLNRVQETSRLEGSSSTSVEIWRQGTHT